MSAKKELLSLAMKRTSEWFLTLFFSFLFSTFFFLNFHFLCFVIMKSVDSYKTGFRISSQEIPSDVTVHVGETSFSLHKVIVLLCSRSNYRR